jgi:hypothetical protein
MSEISQARVAELRERADDQKSRGFPVMLVEVDTVLDLLAALDAANERVKYAETAAVVARDYLDSAKARALAAEAGRDLMKAACDAAFMAMCDYRDNGDAELFQDAIDALGLAALAQEPS